MKFRYQLHMVTDLLYEMWLEGPDKTHRLPAEVFNNYLSSYEIEEVFKHLEKSKHIQVVYSFYNNNSLFMFPRSKEIRFIFSNTFEEFAFKLKNSDTYKEYDLYLLDLKDTLQPLTKLPEDYKWISLNQFQSKKLIKFLSDTSKVCLLFKALINEKRWVSTKVLISKAGIKDYNTLRVMVNNFNRNKLLGSGLKIVPRNKRGGSAYKIVLR